MGMDGVLHYFYRITFVSHALAISVVFLTVFSHNVERCNVEYYRL